MGGGRWRCGGSHSRRTSLPAFLGVLVGCEPATPDLPCLLGPVSLVQARSREPNQPCPLHTLGIPPPLGRGLPMHQPAAAFDGIVCLGLLFTPAPRVSHS
jgi:hypothetical protein